MSTLLLDLFSRPWAMRPEALADAVSLVLRDSVPPEQLASSFHFSDDAQEAALVGETNRYAVHQRASARVEGSNGLFRRGQTAILPITGPITRRGGMTLSSGPLASVELLARDFTRAVEDDAFASILLDVDSPGGEASGIDELARMIYDARGSKPIWAYVSDLGASAAYWLAAAAERVVVAPAAAVGSIGCVMAVRDPKAARDGVIEFVSSMSPNKRPDPTSKDGKAEIQGLVDALGSLFVESVATYRGVSPKAVTSEFGAGGLKVGQAAVDSGMADALGSLESTLRELAEQTKPTARNIPAPTQPDDGPAAESTGRAPVAVAGDSGPELMAPRTGQEDHTMDLLAGLRALVATAEAGDQAASITSQNIRVEASADVNTEAVAKATTEAVVGALGGGVDELAIMRSRAIAAESENRRLRLARIQDRATTFARAQQDAGHCGAAEGPHLVALFAMLAQDDEAQGPIELGGGKTTLRTTFLETFLAARPSRRDLTQEALESHQVVVLGERQSPRRDPNAEPDAARVTELLGATAMGRDVLEALKAAN